MIAEVTSVHAISIYHHVNIASLIPTHGCISVIDILYRGPMYDTVIVKLQK